MEFLTKEHNPFTFLAKLVSVIFHPLLMPSFLFMIIDFYIPFLLSPWTKEGTYMLLWIIFTGTFLVPLILIFLLFHSKEKNFTDFLLMHKSRDRMKPFILTSFIYTLLSTMLYQQLRISNVIVTMVGCMAFSILLSGIISYWWKISIHAVGIGGVIGFLFIFNEQFADGMLFYIVIVSIIISGILLSARLFLNEHSPLQVFSGWLLGLGLSLISFLIFI